LPRCVIVADHEEWMRGEEVVKAKPLDVDRLAQLQCRRHVEKEHQASDAKEKQIVRSI
jgi:hypothetical protein